MRFLKSVLVGLVVLVAMLVAVGIMMPSTFLVERAIAVNAPPAKIYVLLADPKAWKQWAVWHRRDPEMKVVYSGAAAGVGATWSWESGSAGKGSMTLVAADPDREVQYTLNIESRNFSARGTIRLAPGPGGTVVTWSSEGDVGRNPLLRLLAPMADGKVGADFAEGLANLKAAAEKT
ncbi:hypothetical protein BWI17_11900 [Betaproteobacteria bacterium GR16-43]|nr:hypothetical protein BWI17_11900 [Betaproteobacteria bacterium GR16-43]